MIKITSPEERKAEVFTEIKLSLEELSTPILSQTFGSKELENFGNTLREYSQLTEVESPTQIQSYLLELLEFIPWFEHTLKSSTVGASSITTYKLANRELKTRLRRLLTALSDEIEDLQL